MDSFSLILLSFFSCLLFLDPIPYVVGQIAQDVYEGDVTEIMHRHAVDGKKLVSHFNFSLGLYIFGNIGRMRY